MVARRLPSSEIWCCAFAKLACAVASDSPHFIGHGGLIAGPAVLQALREADVVLALGCRFSSWMWDEQGPLARRHHALVNINIDPSALGSPALHQVAMQADAALAVVAREIERITGRP